MFNRRDGVSDMAFCRGVLTEPAPRLWGLATGTNARSITPFEAMLQNKTLRGIRIAY